MNIEFSFFYTGFRIKAKNPVCPIYTNNLVQEFNLNCEFHLSNVIMLIYEHSTLIQFDRASNIFGETLLGFTAYQFLFGYFICSSIFFQAIILFQMIYLYILFLIPPCQSNISLYFSYLHLYFGMHVTYEIGEIYYCHVV